MTRVKYRARVRVRIKARAKVGEKIYLGILFDGYEALKVKLKA